MAPMTDEQREKEEEKILKRIEKNRKWTNDPGNPGRTEYWKLIIRLKLEEEANRILRQYGNVRYPYNI